MNTNKLMLLLAAAVISGAICALSAFAEVTPGSKQERAYKGLTSVHLHPARLPWVERGMPFLSAHESKYIERLPMQLTGPMDKMKKAKYRPRRRS